MFLEKAICKQTIHKLFNYSYSKTCTLYTQRINMDNLQTLADRRDFLNHYYVAGKALIQMWCPTVSEFRFCSNFIIHF